jgi:hypothetical protein
VLAALNPFGWYRRLREENARQLAELVADGTITPFDARLIQVTCRAGLRYPRPRP